MSLRFWTGALALAALTGCPKNKDDDTAETGDSSDNGGDSDSETGDTSVECTAVVTGTTPADGATGVYYRDIFEVSFDSNADTAVIAIRDGAGTEAASEITWSKGSVLAYVTADLAPTTSYTLSVSLCDVVTEIGFTTSDLGTPIAKGSSSIQGKTYALRLSDGTITDPAVLEVLANQYLTVPLLFGVTASDDTSIDLLGALGVENDDHTFEQIDGLPTWDFPVGDFSESPFFSAEAEYITLMYGEYPIPIEEFTLEGTFTSDGVYIREGKATGKADSRYMGPLIGQPADAYSALCDLAATMGVYCEPCADGEPYCLYIVGEEIIATEAPGVTVVEVLK